MSERDFAMALAMLAEAFGVKDLTPVRIEAYHRSLGDVPIVVLNAAVDHAIKTRQWFPKVAELRTDCETARVQLRGALKFDACEGCTPQGFSEVEMDGVKRMQRCQCWTLHQRKVQELGVGDKSLALPPARDWTDAGDAA